jgi:predicted nucleic acid-binding protein
MTILIDSDVLIEVSRGRDAAILHTWARVRDSDTVLLCSPVTVAELWHSARADDHAPLSRLFDCFVCIPADREIGRRAGDFLKQFARSHALELGDALIAATASIHGAQLWTRNKKHYPMKDISFFRHDLSKH